MRDQRILKLVMQLVGILILVLFCLLLWTKPEDRWFFQKKLENYKVHYGQDIEGGSRLIYEIDPEKITSNRSVEDVLDDTKEILSRRIVDSGIVKDPVIQTLGENRLSIELPDIIEGDIERVKKQIKSLGKLQFKMVIAFYSAKDDKVQVSKKLGKMLDKLSSKTGTQKKADALWKQYQKKKKAGPEALKKYLEKMEKKHGVRWLTSSDKRGDRAKNVYLLWISDGHDYEGKKFAQFYTGMDLEQGPTVGFELKQEYQPRFSGFMQKFKSEKNDFGSVDYEYMAVVYNNSVIMSPFISAENPPQGSGSITGQFTAQETRDMVSILRSGSLELEPTFVQRKSQGARYGEEAIRRGIIAGWIGMVLVVIFMIFYYRAAGIIASIALLLNILIIFAVLVIFRETLTLPGIAGIVLTMGMSVDANIIIFERIREERQRRRDLAEEEAKEKKKKKKKKKKDEDEKKQEENIQEAVTRQDLLEHIDEGYSQAFSTIFDANVTTLLTAVILYFFASGTVQGFAFTLGIGILASFFTAIVVTKIFFHLFIETGMVSKLGMAEWITRPNIEFSKKMGKACAFSLVIIAIGLGMFFSLGERVYGLDLRGGVRANMALKEEVEIDQVRTRVKKMQVEMLEARGEKQASASEAEVQKVGDVAGAGNHEYVITLPNMNQNAIDQLQKKLSPIWRELRDKKEDRKNKLTDLARIKDGLDEAENKKKKLQESGENPDDLADAEEAIRNYTAELKSETVELDRLTDEVERLKKEEEILLAKRDELVDVKPLKESLKTVFDNELALPPYGKFEIKRWGPRNQQRKLYQLPVNMHTPVSVDFLKKAYDIGKRPPKDSGFTSAEFGVNKYGILIKLNEKLENDKVIAELKKSFEIKASIKLDPKNFSTKKSESGDWDVHVSVDFNFAVPEYLVKEVVEKSNLGKFELVLTEDGEDIKEFTLFLSVSGIAAEKTLDEIEQYAHNFAAGIKNHTYKGHKIYLSEPFPMIDQVSGAIARSQKAKAYRAILLSLVLILLYIGVRFPTGLRFGMGAVTALAHDVLIALGAISVFFWLGIVDVKISVPAIAALLTIVGYSLNDTIVIFDRIRENKSKNIDLWDRMTKAQVTEEFDRSLNQTLSRTLLTSITTLVVLFTIFLLNINQGTVIEGFSFILIVGVLVGTYSSLFIATPVVLALERREHN